MILFFMYGAILIGYVRAGDGPKKPPGLTFWIFNGPILLFLFIVGLGGGNGGSSSSSQHTQKYCKYPGCTEPPSEVWEAGTGYCHRHAQQLRDEQKLLDKMKKQGY
jgi:hypothetical protein